LAEVLVVPRSPFCFAIAIFCQEKKYIKKRKKTSRPLAINSSFASAV